MGRLYVILGIVAVVGVGVVAYLVGGGTGEAAIAPIAIPGIQEDPNRLVELAQGVIAGEESSVRIIEFGDHQCPACAMFALQEKPRVDLELVETGRAQFVFYDYPLISVHPHAFLAARAARCAEDQGRFWDYQDHLFRMQSRWSPAAAVGSLFEDYAAEVGLDERAFSACLNSDRHAELVSANLALSEALGVPRTPTILVEHDGIAEAVEPVFAAIAARVEELLGQP